MKNKGYYFLLLFLILIMLFLRFHQEYQFANLTSDDSVFLQAIQRFEQGLGFSNCRYIIENNSIVKECSQVSLFPVGYAFFLYPIYKIIGNLFLTQIISQCLGVL